MIPPNFKTRIHLIEALENTQCLVHLGYDSLNAEESDPRPNTRSLSHCNGVYLLLSASQVRVRDFVRIECWKESVRSIGFLMASC